jgi:hypothetical protein
MKATPEQITVTRKCKRCEHEQDVTSAASDTDADGTKHYYFGSAHWYCDRCDGPMEDKEQP